MPGYATRRLLVRVHGLDFHLRALSDLQQYSDRGGLADQAGISSANWSLFGQLWPASRVLAESMAQIDVAGKRVLEFGCGLGLSSLVLQRRGADVTASDHHPLAESFLRHNAGLNDLALLPYCDLPWAGVEPRLGRFDLLIGSDVLYERGHCEMLSGLLQRHAKAAAECIITDPGRGNSGPFTRAMRAQGYDVTEERGPFNERDLPPYRGRLLHYRRG